jgi:hypothetical protein
MLKKECEMTCEMTRREMQDRDRDLFRIANVYFGWGTDNVIDMPDATAHAVRGALEAAYAAGRARQRRNGGAL